MRSTFHLATLAIVGLGGCGGGPSPSVDTPDASPDASTGETSFALESPDAEHDLRFLVALSEHGGSVRVVSGRRVDLFGVSYHLRWDENVMEVTDLEQGPFLGSEAVMLVQPGTGDAALGGTRRGPGDGNITVEPDTELLAFTVRGLAAGTAPMAIADVVARRADGSYTPLTTASGTFTFPEPAR